MLRCSSAPNGLVHSSIGCFVRSRLLHIDKMKSAVLHQHPRSLQRPQGERPHYSLHAAKHRWSVEWTYECGWALIRTICGRHLPSNVRRWMKNREGNEMCVRSLRKWMNRKQNLLATVGNYSRPTGHASHFKALTNIHYLLCAENAAHGAIVKFREELIDSESRGCVNLCIQSTAVSSPLQSGSSWIVPETQRGLEAWHYKELDQGGKPLVWEKEGDELVQLCSSGFVIEEFSVGL